jgi:predicted Zn-dependent peptidase
MKRFRSVPAVLASVSFAFLWVGCHRVEETHFQLSNGLAVRLVRAGHEGTAGAALLYAVGSDEDPSGRSGMTRVIDGLLQASEPSWRVRGGRDYTAQTVVAPSERLPGLLSEAASRMATLEVQEPELVKQRSAVLAELARARGGDAALAAAEFASEAILPSPGNGWRAGVAAEIEQVSAADAQAFWDAHYKPANARLVVVGDLDLEALEARIRTAFAEIPAGKAPQVRVPTQSHVAGDLVMGSAPAALAMAVPVPPIGAAAYSPFLVLASRLMAQPSAGHRWQVDFAPLERPDVLVITSPLHPPERPEDTARQLRKELDPILSAPLSAADVRSARERFARTLGLAKGSASDYLEDPEGTAFALARREQLQVDAAELSHRLDSLTPDAVSDAAKLFGPDHSAAVAAGGESQ